MLKRFKPVLFMLFSLSLLLLGGCSEYKIFDPKGPVAATQRDLIMYSIYFMLFIMVIVYILFTFVVVKYRNRKNFKESDYDPSLHHSTKLEILWTIIPIIIVIALSIPTVKVLYELEGPPKATAHKEPIVIHATSADWKWIFSYPEEDIETVNYVKVPEDRPILFKITSADSMTSFWVPQIGGQEYGMPGMVNDLYLQADEPGVYDGMNSNFTGKKMAFQRFNFIAVKETDYDKWVKDTQEKAPELTEEKYEKLMLPDSVGEMTFSNTHLGIVDHGVDSGTYAMKIREKYGVKQENPHQQQEETASNEESSAHEQQH
ncbi:cytochrome aa3 quinol oxidase subunit II [Metabacillus fastidiosus]|uniref:Quinol oxidase subunit 2 n=1 Tax=Metabacillus fastidiosus TaxID=1458 RepID=A0ABU6P371_9BACI|nr:cytochrome aa3 quinol oxidase subunit II [Metabacillus fastidiosus]MED4403815.1 cytochrome aa3 quinol oxidase subunit II [Metabacillus fastidiosus]MED4456092.1 cytochrome aa3 quinol oxidase subunit II [Metabacillus fastidiosus]MED4464359.1 cytochrome aa3 quinol oxidase subunit II [Metabacillus fastidiosus]